MRCWIKAWYKLNSLYFVKSGSSLLNLSSLIYGELFGCGGLDKISIVCAEDIAAHRYNCFMCPALASFALRRFK
ncbi:hypothetical protein [Campylobacter gracilis]|uniref:Uncharacterized protein n=1 Tax=Campylobacter gracilis RM3268 TaxID=553220 RepID=C8PF62_9BACT|nr:hypothetical protein [Campylobacter gracilis]EEV18690.1 hypothetical protein CAMGR0001_2703 [Campylobacter gracilis RM3268]